MNWREYHQLTKHSLVSLQRTPHVLDWSNMPDPFRQYEGAPVLDLPSEVPPIMVPALAALRGRLGSADAHDGPTFLTRLLFHSAAVSASKVVPSTGSKYALRVNPSSGNLHPTEFHFLTSGLRQWPAGLYHYRPSSHMAEFRAEGRFRLDAVSESAPLIFVLTSIVWREAWKYGDRAYRYCLLDIGHAWLALALAAQAIGCGVFARGSFDDDGATLMFDLPEDEWPMLVVELRGNAIPPDECTPCETVRHGGQPNVLSAEQVAYPRIDAIHISTKHGGRDAAIAPRGPRISGGARTRLPRPATSVRPFGGVVRGRRSALDFRGGSESLSLTELSAILDVARQPLSADFAGHGFVELFLYVHRVESLDPGVYRYCMAEHELALVKSGDQRVAAAGLSLGQELAGNACVAISMIGAIELAASVYGDRGYRYVHFEAGAIGHRLYLAAEALGLGATGIGAFLDDEVHRYLGLAPTQGQVVYHFAIGHPVADSRTVASIRGVSG